MKEIFLFRHGQTDLNKVGIVQGQGVDSDLNELGRLQSHLIYREFVQENFDLVITSELKRSIQTMKYFLDDKIPHLIMSEVNEINWGIYEGKPSTHKSKAEFKKLINSWKNGEFSARLEGGESGEELMSRIYKFWDFIYSNSAGKIAVCTHGRTMRGILSYFLMGNFLHMESFQHNNGGLYRLLIKDATHKILLSNDIGHLMKMNEV